MKIKFLALVLVVCTNLLAQTKDEKEYKKRSAEVKQEIFGTPDANFATNVVPAEYKDESAVIIAKKVHYTMDKKNRFRLTLFGPTSIKRLTYFTTIRYKVKINDKNALEEFSSLEYQKQANLNMTYVFTRIMDKSFTFIGIKIIKPDGKENDVNTDEEILTRDEKKIKEGKLAVSGLEIGDIVDYYIRVEEVQDLTEKTMGPYIFTMGGDYPILSLDVKFVVDKKAGIACRSNNGAPKFKQTRNEDDDFEFSILQKNLPKIKGQMWQYPLRQTPYIILSYNTAGGIQKPYLAGQVTESVSLDDYLDLLTKEVDRNTFGSNTKYSLGLIKDDLKKAFGKDYENANKDSLAMFIFNSWQHNSGYKFSDEDGKPKYDCSINNKSLYNFYKFITLHLQLRGLDIDNEIVVTTPVNGSKQNDILYYGDYDFIIRTSSKKPIYFNWDNRFIKPYELPTRFQGQEGLVLDIDKKNNRSNTYNRSKTVLPASIVDDNVTKENIEVKFNADNITKFSMSRQVSVRGHYRANTQKQLCLPEETNKINAAYLGLKDVVTELNEDKKTRKQAEEYTAGFKEAKDKWNEQFKEEFKEQFGTEAKEVTNYKIENYALRHWEKDFVFSSTYTVEDWVKKAGNNYLFEVGKLMGTFSKVEEKERKRTLDIYMPCARSFEYSFTINVPDGYIAKGIDALNKNVTNDAASFVSTATANGNIVTVTVKRVYNHAFEPVANWDKLLQAMDAGYDFTNAKLLFEKKK